MSKTLVLFYSFEGNTRKVAEFISQELGLISEELEPVKDLKSTGFSKYIWGGKQVIMGDKPELIPIVSNIDDYDTIILGSPVWAGTFTPAIKTALEGGKLKGKKIAYFYCHDGGPGKSDAKCKKAIEINNEFISSIGLERVKTNYESVKLEALNWAREIVNK